MRIFILLIILRIANALIGYDCGGRHLNITSVSLLQAGDCDLDIKTTNSTDTYIQLLQLSDYNYAEIIQCKVEIIRTLYYCGMHSHISAVTNGLHGYIEETSAERCQQMHKAGTASIGLYGQISGLRPNSTTSRAVTLAGEININGDCKGVQYSDPYGTWTNVIALATVRITLRSSYAPVHLASGKIMLKSGQTCPLKEGFCVDQDHGHTYWKPMPTFSCDFHQYDVLYEGPAKKTRTDELTQPSPLVFSLITEDITFALTTTRSQPLCGYTLLRTEHPKLFILETTKANVPKRKTSIPVDNLDIFTYVNSKFVYVENHLRTQMTSLYYNTIQQRCTMEKEVIKNTLSLAKLLPDEFAYRLMNQPGYMSVIAGEAVHVIKCIPVNVIVRKTEECYNELPIFVRNASMFLTPKSRIITKVGMQRECTNELPTMYNIDGTWIQLVPGIQQRQIPPQELQPMTKMTWTYLTPGSLATSGIYSQQDIDKLRDHIMFPAEKPALLNSVARGIHGYSSAADAASVYDLLNEDALNKIAESTTRRIWSGFVSFGSATAGIMGIFIIIRIVKIVIDTAIHGYALHMAYGCSLHLIGAVWSSLAHLLLHLARGPPKEKQENKVDPVNSNIPPNAPEPREDTIPLRIITTQPRATQEPSVTQPYQGLLKCLNDKDQNPPNTSDVCSFSRRGM